MPPSSKERLEHLLLPTTAETFRYTSPGTVRHTFTTPPRDRHGHAESLIGELRQVEQALPDVVAEQRAFGLDGVNGIYLSFESQTGYELKFDSLDFRRNGIELCSVKEEAGRTIAAVFVPDGKLGYFLSKVEQYRDAHTDKGKPRNKELVEGIEHIKVAALQALWTDPVELFPEPGASIWWEVWLRRSVQFDHEAFVRVHAERLGLRVKTEAIRFIDRVVMLAYGTREQMGRSVHLLAAFAELRLAKDSAAFFAGMDRRQQRDWIASALARLQLPVGDGPAVCVLDTGVNHAHPLLAPAAAAADMHTYQPGWGTDDRYGHGTPMAGLALYGDLTGPLGNDDPIRLTHRLESVKVVPRPGFHDERELFGAITRDCIAQAELPQPHRQRVFCLALTSTDGRDRGRPSSWSATLDALSSGMEDEVRRMLVVSAGNTDPTKRHEYPDSNFTDPIHDPGQSWNGLTVGAYTDKSILDTDRFPGWEPLAVPGDLAPASCTALRWEKTSWPWKPDLVVEGGNMARSPVDGSADYIDDGMQLLSTGHQFEIDKPLVSFGDTSAAAALAARLATMVQAQYPALWPETIRALLVHSARWTDAMRARFDSRTPTGRRCLLQCFGFGVPDEEALFWSARDSLTLIAQAELQPFFKEHGGAIKTRDVHLHSLPWPVEVLEQLGEVEVELKVTLSYFVEPNPGQRGWSRKFSYQSHGLRFDVKRPLESDADFKQRINREARDEEYDGAIPDSGEWLLGKMRNRGSIHSDTWRGTAVALARRGRIAVFPVLGWWRECPALERWGKRARYALVVSIRTPDVACDIYTPVHNRIRALVEL
jgi:hypothetical protein